jgi:hypothetical protein
LAGKRRKTVRKSNGRGKDRGIKIDVWNNNKSRLKESKQIETIE